MSIIWLAAFSFINVRPIQKDEPTKQSWYLRSGAELLRLFLITATANLLMVCAYFVYFRSVLFDEVCAGMFFKGIWVLTILNLAGMAVLETIFFGTHINKGCIQSGQKFFYLPQIDVANQMCRFRITLMQFHKAFIFKQSYLYACLSCIDN